MAKRRSGPYRLTPARRGALKKAQLASARKRRRNIGIALGVSAGALTAGGIVARHRLSGSKIQARTGVNTSIVTGKRMASGFRTGPNTIVGALGSRKVSLSYIHKRLLHFEGGGHNDTRDYGLLKSGGSFGIKTPRHYGAVGINRKRVLGKRIASGINDTVPLYNPKTQRSWPHTDPVKSRRTNQRLRERGMIA